MPDLKDNPSLKDLQQYQTDLCKERGWDDSDELEVFLLFSEEIGELAKAIRNKKKLYVEKGKERPNAQQELEREFADVLGYLLELANHFDVDLEEAFKEKEAYNLRRDWGKRKGEEGQVEE